MDHLIRGHKELLPVLNELQTNDDNVNINTQYFVDNCMSYYYGSSSHNIDVIVYNKPNLKKSDENYVN